MNFNIILQQDNLNLVVRIVMNNNNHITLINQHSIIKYPALAKIYSNIVNTHKQIVLCFKRINLNGPAIYVYEIRVIIDNGHTHTVNKLTPYANSIYKSIEAFMLKSREEVQSEDLLQLVNSLVVPIFTEMHKYKHKYLNTNNNKK